MDLIAIQLEQDPLRLGEIPFVNQALVVDAFGATADLELVHGVGRQVVQQDLEQEIRPYIHCDTIDIGRIVAKDLPALPT